MLCCEWVHALASPTQGSRWPGQGQEHRCARVARGWRNVVANGKSCMFGAACWLIRSFCQEYLHDFGWLIKMDVLPVSREVRNLHSHSPFLSFELCCMLLRSVAMSGHACNHCSCATSQSWPLSFEVVIDTRGAARGRCLVGTTTMVSKAMTAFLGHQIIVRLH
jgi:hypothetical protein